MIQEDNRYPQVNPYMDDMEDDIDIMEYVRKLLKGWRFIFKCCCVGVVLGLVVAFSLVRSYTSTSKLAPEVASRSGGGNLSSLASLAGINLGSVGTADVMSPELYPEIVSSTPFVVDLFSLPVQFKYKKEDTEAPLYDYLKDYTRTPWWSSVMSAPFKALGWFMGLFREKVEPVEGFDNVNPVELTNKQARIAKVIRESVVVNVDKKTSLVTITTTAQDPHVAAQVCQAVIDKLQSYITDYRTEKARHDLEYYESLYEKAQESYFEAQQKYARYVDANQGVVLQRVRTEESRLQNEMNLRYELYNSCAQQVQMAKAKVQEETPVYTVLLPASVPLKPEKPSKAMVLALFVFLSAMVGSAWVLWGKEFLASMKSDLSEDKLSAE